MALTQLPNGGKGAKKIPTPSNPNEEARFQCLTMLSELDGEVKLEMIQGSGDDDDDDQESPLIMDTSLGTTFTAITLADGTQAFMAEDLGLKSDDLQGETLQLEDGSAVLIQEIPNFLEGQPITLEDGTTAFISSSNNEDQKDYFPSSETIGKEEVKH
ncbi:unnamed protein product, partial [Timema podura]|nr:unnamed protein product [Timema podura]